MTEHAAVLFANDAFYVAFAARDTDAMDAVWARRAPITCIHPGWHPLSGRDAVLDSWHAILGGPNPPEIACVEPTAHVHGETAVVLCYEAVSGGFLVATNVFVREDGDWRMVHHQAGPASGPPPERSAEPPTLQ